MNRFALHAVVDMAKMVEESRGAWVRFEQAWPLIAEAQGKLGSVRRERDELQRQLAEVTKERDQLQAALKLADALRNRQIGGGK